MLKEEDDHFSKRIQKPNIPYNPFEIKNLYQEKLLLMKESLRKQLKLRKKSKIQIWKLDFQDTRVDQAKWKIFMKEFHSTKPIKRANLSFFWCSIATFKLKKLSDILKNFLTIQDPAICFNFCHKFSDEGLHCLWKSLKRLRFLNKLSVRFWECYDISHTRFEMFGKALKTLPSLKNVRLCCKSYEYPERQPVKPRKRRSFIMKKNSSQENIYKYMKSCPFLENIWLFYFGPGEMDDRRLQSFSKNLTSLETIYICFCSCKDISDVGLFCLCKVLRKSWGVKNIRLDFYHCEKLTKKGIDEALECLEGDGICTEINSL